MDFGLYIIITKPVLAHTRIAEICVRQKIKYLQLREKSLNDKELLQIARDLKSITKDSQTMFIVNDRVDICILSDADGLHLGQDDISICDVKKLLHKKIILGVSTHNLQQFKEAQNLDLDYIGFGPIYKTPTKLNPDPVVGTDMLNNILPTSKIPVVAIGGIDEDNISEVLNAGAKNLCMVRALMNTSDFENKIIRIRETMSKHLNKSGMF